MRMTPLDIRGQRFPRRWHGYDSGDVEGFLSLVADDYEALVREAESLRETAHRLESRVRELSAQEDTLRSTLVTAQSMSEDLKRTALKETEVLLGEAEVRAQKILDAAHRRAARLAEQIREMKSLRARVATAVRTTIETHLALLEGLGADDGDGAENIAYLAPKAQAASSGEDA